MLHGENKLALRKSWKSCSKTQIVYTSLPHDFPYFLPSSAYLTIRPLLYNLSKCCLPKSPPFKFVLNAKIIFQKKWKIIFPSQTIFLCVFCLASNFSSFHFAPTSGRKQEKFAFKKIHWMIYFDSLLGNVEALFICCELSGKHERKIERNYRLSALNWNV